MSGYSKEQLAWFAAHKDDDQGPDVYATVVVCVLISYVAVILRFVSRRIMKGGWLWDDWLIVLALFTMTGMHLNTAIAIRNGFGRHLPFASNPVVVAKCAIAIQTTYSFAVLFTKTSILAFYYRLFPTRSMLIMTIVISVVVFLYSAALVVVTMLQCIPLQKIWTPMMDGICLQIGVAYLVLSITNVLTDFAILILPVRNVWQLHMDKTRKLQISGIFLLGGIVCVFGVVRSVFVSQADTADPTWTAVKGGIWSQVELSVGIVCACLPIYRPLFSKSARLRARDPSEAYKFGSSKGKKLRDGTSNSSNDGVRMSHLSGHQARSQKVWANATARTSQDDASASDKAPFAVTPSHPSGGDDMVIRVDRSVEHTWAHHE